MGVREKVINAITSEKTNGWSGLLQKSLLPLSLFYQGGAAVRSSLYAHGLIASKRLSRPVISVGNLVVGGTGKTPLVIKIVQNLSSQGIRLAVLSRGYKGKARGPVNVVSDLDEVCLDAEVAGDEPYLMARKLSGTPVLVGRDRFALGREAIRRFDVDCLILDDGFQHLSLRRECNLLLLDGGNPFGNGRCLPAGTMREGNSAIRRADMIVISGEPEGDLLSNIRSIAANRPIHRLQFIPDGVRSLSSGEVKDCTFLKGKRLLAFAGIARPERFFKAIEGLGAEVVIQKSFPDHYTFRKDEVKTLLQEGEKSGADFMVTTEKDAARLPEIPEVIPMFVLQLKVEIRDTQRFFGDILRYIGKTEIRN